MEKGILTFKWVCGDLVDGVYKSKKWVCSSSEIVKEFKPPYVDLDEGWYVDLDKRVCYYYSRYFDTNAEVVEHLIKIKDNPISFPVDSFVRYEYSLWEFESGECDILEYMPIREKMTCLCKEGTTENCHDEKSLVKVERLDSCVKTEESKSVYIKTTGGPWPV